MKKLKKSGEDLDEIDGFINYFSEKLDIFVEKLQARKVKIVLNREIGDKYRFFLGRLLKLVSIS